MNTRINYMYRDASNYKSFNTAVVDGVLSDTDCNVIYHCCDDDGGQRYFIPHMVGLRRRPLRTMASTRMTILGSKLTRSLPRAPMTRPRST